MSGWRCGEGARKRALLLDFAILGLYDEPIRKIWHVVPFDEFIPFGFAFGKIPYL